MQKAQPMHEFYIQDKRYSRDDVVTYKQCSWEGTRELSNFSVLSILLPGSASVIVVGDPRDLVLAALPGFDVIDVHPIELLESSVFTFNNEEVDHEDSDEETAREDVAVREIDGSGDEGSEETKATVSTVRIRRYL